MAVVEPKLTADSLQKSQPKVYIEHTCDFIELPGVTTFSKLTTM